MSLSTFTWNTPSEDKLVNLIIKDEFFDDFKAYATQLPSIKISSRSVCDLEMLATGAFSPLDRFMGQADHQRVLDELRLTTGEIFPIPITLPVEAGSKLHLDQDVALRNSEFELIGIMTIEEIFDWDRSEVAEKVFGTHDLQHPLVAEMHSLGDLNISGQLRILHLPVHYDFQDLWLTPTQTRARLAAMEHWNVVAVQPYSTLHYLNVEPIEKIVEDVNGVLFLHPAVGMAKVGDIRYFSRVRSYKTLIEAYNKPMKALLSLMPMASRMAGHREVLWQALIHRNYGATHMLVLSDHYNAVNFSGEKSMDNPWDVQELAEKYSQELDLQLIPEPKQTNKTSTRIKTSHLVSIPANDLMVEKPNNGHSISSKHKWSEINAKMAETHLTNNHNGVCIWFTGLSGAGKSTTAQILTWLLLEHGRRVTVLDGDIVRTHLSRGLGFSKEDRNTNVRRIGFVASELVYYGAVVICAVVSPYRVARNDVRNMVGKEQFVEVFVNTPLYVCENRDVKGLYAKARRGELSGFTGIDDPYEPPDHPEITLDTVNHTPQENADLIVEYLIEQGFIQIRQDLCQDKE